MKRSELMAKWEATTSNATAFNRFVKRNLSELTVADLRIPEGVYLDDDIVRALAQRNLSYEDIEILVPFTRSPEVLAKWARHHSVTVRREVARNPFLDPASQRYLLAQANAKGDQRLWNRVLSNLVLPPDEFEQLRYELRPMRFPFSTRDWVRNLTRQEDAKAQVLSYFAGGPHRDRAVALAVAVLHGEVPGCTLFEIFQVLQDAKHADVDHVVWRILDEFHTGATLEWLSLCVAWASPFETVRTLLALQNDYAECSEEETTLDLVRSLGQLCADVKDSDVTYGSGSSPFDVMDLLLSRPQRRELGVLFVRELVRRLEAGMAVEHRHPKAVRVNVCEAIGEFLTHNAGMLDTDFVADVIPFSGFNSIFRSSNALAYWVEGTRISPTPAQFRTALVRALAFHEVSLSEYKVQGFWRTLGEERNRAYVDVVLDLLGAAAFSVGHSCVIKRIVELFDEACAENPHVFDCIHGLLPTWDGDVAGLIATGKELARP